MTRPKTDYLWIGVFAVLVTFAVPWFMWGDATTWAGVPAWVWWHVGWMALASAAFYLFTRGAWDRWMALDAEEV